MAQRSPDSSSPNLGAIGLLLGAGALVVYGLTRKSKSGWALAAAGGALAYKSAKTQFFPETEDTAHARFLLNTTPEQAYSLWRQFENLPRFMAHLQSVRELSNTRSEWTALGPRDTEVRWTAEITEDQPGRLISWQSLPGSDVTTSGTVRFDPGPVGKGTMVTADVRYTLPVGPAGKALLTAMGKNPQFVVREDLRRFKALLEAGEAPTTVGQSHGPRGLHGNTEAFLFRETSNRPLPQAGQSAPAGAQG